MEDNPKKRTSFDDITDSAKEYVNLKIDEYKLRSVEGLSTLFNLIFFIIVATIVAGVALQLLGFAAGYAIGEATGSNALGFTIMGVIFLLVVLVLYLCRKRLFVNQLVRLFIKLFFDNGQK